jgi:hypothetical protein
MYLGCRGDAKAVRKKQNQENSSFVCENAAVQALYRDENNLNDLMPSSRL